MKDFKDYIKTRYENSIATYDDGMNSVGDACSSTEQQTLVHTLYEIAKVIGISDSLVDPPPVFEEFSYWDGINGTQLNNTED